MRAEIGGEPAARAPMIASGVGLHSGEAGASPPRSLVAQRLVTNHSRPEYRVSEGINGELPNDRLSQPT